MKLKVRIENKIFDLVKQDGMITAKRAGQEV